ncbi:MAG: hypothetical protein JKY37_28085 [Nannocystaceae bacterium]|nr:hypothetical protein [Nannocystaceae bacterium]
MAREVTLVDAGLGNLASVERALVQVGAGVRITNDPDKVATSRMVVFPGQSAFGVSTQAVIDGAMGAALRMVIERGDPFLGICLGMQLLFDGSDENNQQEGLHVLDGWCRRFPDTLTEAAEPGAINKTPQPADVISATALPPQSVIEDDDPILTPGQFSQTSPGQVTAFGASEESAEESTEESEPTEPAETAAGDEDADPDLAPASDANPTSGAPLDLAAGAMTATPTTSPDASQSLVVSPPSGLLAPAPPSATATPEPTGPLIRRLKVPHMGWNEVEPTGDHYYFVHSFYVEPKNSEDVMWMTRYGDIRFPAAVRRGNVLGCQFHPEKSQRAGLRFLRAFLLGGWG